MSKSFIPAALAAACLALPSQGAIVWSENFDGVDETADVGTNANVGNVQFANTLVADVTSTIPAAFTTGAGNVALMSTGANDFAAIRPASTSNPVTFTASAGDTYALTFDLYIPTTLATDVGQTQFRFKVAGFTANGGEQVVDGEVLGVTAAGLYSIAVSGTFPVDNGAGAFVPDNARPFISFDQRDALNDGVAVADFAYIDNIALDISPVPEPASMALLGLGATAMLGRRRRA